MARFTTKAIRVYAEDDIGVKPAVPNNLILSPMTSYGIKEEYSSEDIECITDGGEATPMVYGRPTSAGDMGFKLTGELMPVIANFLIGTATQSAGTTDDWAGTTAVAVGDVVNHSDGTHSLYCQTAGTTDAAEPIVGVEEEYEEITDGTVVWVLRDVLYKYNGTRESCLPTFGIEVELEDSQCLASPEATVYFRYEGCYMGTGGFGKAGADVTFDSTVSVMASSATNSLKPTGGTYETQGGTDDVFNKEFFTNCDLEVTIDGVTVANTKEFKLDVDRQLEQEGLIDCTDLINIGIIKLTGTSNMLFDTAVYDRGINQTSHEVIFTYSHKGDVAIFSLPTVRFSKTSPEIEVGKFVALSSTFSASGTADIPSISYEIISSLPAI